MCSLFVKSPHEICGPLCLSPVSPNIWQNRTSNYCITTFISFLIHFSLASSYSALDNLGYCKCNQIQQVCLVWRFVFCGLVYSQNNYCDQSCTIWCSFLAHLWLHLHSDTEEDTSVWMPHSLVTQIFYIMKCTSAVHLTVFFYTCCPRVQSTSGKCDVRGGTQK